MNLDQQLEIIVKDAANYNVPPVVVERAIAPVLGSIATQLKHLEYYILQNLAEDWVLTTISNRKLNREQRVIYAFSSVRDAATQGKTNPDLIAMPISIIQLLFRLFSLQEVDSIVFLEDSQNLNRGVEVKRELIVSAIEQQIRQLNNTPPDIA